MSNKDGSECDHLWIAGGLMSDWLCENCGQRSDMPELEFNPLS